MTRHFLEIDDLTPTELQTVLSAARRVPSDEVMRGRGAALIFEKPSLRTRNSTEMAVAQLGGHPVTIGPDEIGIDTRESAEDIARTLSQYHSVICARVFEHSKLERMADAASVPIVNLLSNDAHPIQVLADLLTIEDEFGADLSGITVAYVGDANNVARSLSLGCAARGLNFRIGAPEGYHFNERDRQLLVDRGAVAECMTDPVEAVRGAQVVYTDAWFSMGQEAEAAIRRPVFGPYQVNEILMAQAAPDAIFMHCLPAHRGEEVTNEVVDGVQSRVWAQAQHRMHSARGLIWWLLEQAASDGSGASDGSAAADGGGDGLDLGSDV